MKKLLGFVLLALLFAGCGYKPASYYSKKAIGDKVFVKVSMLRSDPENTVFGKDAINEAVMIKFKSKLVSEEEATTKLFIKLDSVGFAPIQYDKNGYVVLYRATVTINTNVVSQKHTKTIVTTGSYDFPIEPNTTVSDSKRFEAIKNGGAKAIDALTSQISILGALDGVRTDSSKGN